MSDQAYEIDWSNPEAAKREVRHLQKENDELRDLMRSMENSQEKIEGDLSRKLEEARGRIAELTIEADRHVEEIGHLRDEVEAQDAKITELEAAIEPFADALPIGSTMLADHDMNHITIVVTCADLRNARSKLEGKSDG